MKKTMMIFLMLAGLVIGTYGQEKPVSWSFSAKKIASQTYELHLTPTVASPWHLYSQFTPAGGPVPTSFSFMKNPIISLEGKVREVGKLTTKREEVFGIDVKFFEGKVDFVQVVKVKGKVKTFVSGTLEYMVCNDRECLPPAKVPFKVELK